MQRFDYFLRRLLMTIPTFLGITFCCFGITQLVPGGPIEQRIARMQAGHSAESGAQGDKAALSAEYMKALRSHFGFDRPIHERYWNWLVTKRLGMAMESYKYPNKTAWQIVRERFPVSLVFGITGFLATYLVCIPLGIAKALRHGSRFDTASSLLVFAGYAMPPLAFGMVLRMLFCGTVEGFWNVFPPFGFHSLDFDALSFGEKVKDIAMHMFLPVCCYMVGHFALLTVLMKNSLLDQIGSDYIRTVLAKGGTYRRAVWGHALRNAMIPIATGFGGVLTLMFAGSVIIEQVFEIPGMGRLGLEAIVGRDYAVFMGVVSLTSGLSLLGNILSDFSYVLIDPRIHFDR